MTGADRIKRLLKDKGWSGRELARRAGLPPSTVARWIRGETSPQWEDAEALSRALGVPASTFLEGASDLSDDERLLIRAVRAMGLTYEEALRRLGQALPPRIAAEVRDPP